MSETSGGMAPSIPNFTWEEMRGEELCVKLTKARRAAMGLCISNQLGLSVPWTWFKFFLMSVETLLHEVKSLPTQERSRFFEELRRLEDENIPADFWQGLADCESGRVVGMETALKPKSES